MPGLSRMAVVLLLAGCVQLKAQLPSPRLQAPTLHIPRASHPPRLEDFLNGVPTAAAAKLDDFRQYEPGDGVPASQQTAAYLSYDDKNLYVVFVCQDEPGKVRAHMSKREDIAADDKVVVNIDTFHDHRHAYGFFANPLGVQLDSMWTEGQGGDETWDTLWYSEGRLIENGYAVWMAIPFKSMRFPNAPAQKWGIELGRAIQRNNEMSTWPYVTQRVESFAGQFAHVEGLEQISSGRNLQFIPYFVFGRSRLLDPLDRGGPGFRTDTEARAGVDAKMVLRNALTLDVTVNPDFSQVESDEPQVTVNQRFEVFFPEKRPFFIENAGYFETPINLFFSRRIAEPQGGVRLTGKLGRWSIGGMAIDDRAPGKLVPGSDRLHGERAGIGVARIQREFRNQSTLGVLITSRDLGPTSNRVLSLDTRLELDANWVFAGQAISSRTRQLAGTSSAGSAYWAELSHTGRHLLYAARYADNSPEFHTDLGFVPRVDVRKMEHYFRYYWKPEGKRVVVFGPDVTTTVNWNHAGQLQDWIVDASFGGDLRGPIGMGCRHINAFELFQGRGFRHANTDCGINAGWLKWLEFTIDYGGGTGVNYYPAPGLTPFLGRSTTAKAGFTWRPSPRFRLSQNYLYTRLGVHGASVPAGTSAGASMFNNHILRAKLNYQFTRPLSLRVIVDYNAVLANPMLFALEPTKRVTGDLLITYMLNPGTALYAGYTDIYENAHLLAGAPAPLRRYGVPGVSTGRQVFIKLSYLFRF